MIKYPLSDVHRRIIIQRLDIRLKSFSCITEASECHLCGKRDTGWQTNIPKKDVKDTICKQCGGVVVTRTMWDLEDQDGRAEDKQFDM